MDGVGTPIIGRPRPLPSHDTPNPAHNTYTLKCEEPVIVGGAGAYTINNTEWLTSSLGGRIAWGIMAMVLVWAIYFTFNSALYKASEIAYRVISFALIVGCSLYIMFKLVLHLMEKVGPQLANDSATNHMIYICIAVVIALVAWLRRQAIMDELDEEGKLKLGSRRRSKAE